MHKFKYRAFVTQIMDIPRIPNTNSTKIIQIILENSQKKQRKNEHQSILDYVILLVFKL